MKGLMFTLGAAAIVFGASYAQSAPAPFDYGYEADALPESSTPSWNRYFDGDVSVSGGILTVTTPGTHGGSDPDFSEIRLLGGSGQPWDTTGAGTTVEVKVKTDYNVSGHSWAGSILIDTGVRRWHMLIGEGYITDNAGGGDFPIVTNDAFHTYRFVIADETNGPLDMYVDGNTTPTNSWGGAGSVSSRIAFGDLGNSDQGQVQWDYVRWTNDGAYAPVPEPASLSLMALGALALRRRRA
jgi:hypothetical protein